MQTSQMQRAFRASGRPQQLRAAMAPRLNKRFVKASASAPETGHHTVSDELRDEALAHFFDGPCKTSPTTGGVNNVCQFVDAPDGKRYVLRVYNNGGKSDKVAFEHEVLAQLNKQRLSFQVPRTRPSLSTGAPFVKLSSGDDACVFELIPGRLAKTAAPREVGRATAELCAAMGRIDMGGRESSAPVAPYFRLFDVHHSMTRELFYKQVAENKGLDVCRADIDFLTDEIRAIEPKLEAYQTAGFPMQVLHGDLHYDNVLVVQDPNTGEEVCSGLLDFEFVAYDWRVMELAVALSKFVGEEDPLPFIEEFVSGYAQSSRAMGGGADGGADGGLTAAELEALPDCINLRIFSNVVYFTGRAYSGEDDLKSLTSRAASYAQRVRWVNANRGAIVAAAKRIMLGEEAAVAARR